MAGFTAWFLLGTISISILQWSHAQATGGVGGLLKVGIEHPVAETIRAEVPDIPLAHGLGHDGQLYYAIGLDLTGLEMPDRLDSMESVSYRYRRIGYPAISSVFGLLDGDRLIWGMVAVNALSAGVATAAAAAIAQHFRRSSWAALAVVLNPGVWLSALLSTADNLALAAGLLAILAFLNSRLRWAVAGLAVAVLTKEVALVFTVGLAGYSWWNQRDNKTAIWLVLGSIGPIAAWMLFVQSNVGGIFDSAGNLDFPLVGLIQGAGSWPDESLHENLLNAVTLLCMFTAAFGLFRRRPLWRWLTWPWIGIGLISSHLVWDLGNNSIRVFAPVVILTILGLVDERHPPNRPAESTSIRSHDEFGVR